jgi:chromosome segregation ATPase
MALSAINIVLNAVTDLFNRDVKAAADTMEKSSAKMQQSANKAGQAIEQSLGSGQLRQKIAAVTAEIDEQKQITREFMMELEKLRQKRDTMSKMDVQGQKRVRKEIEQTKAAIKDQSIAVSELTAKKQGFTQQLSSTNQTLSGSRAALNGLATSFSSVSSVLAIVNDDNKQLRHVLMATNAALNFGAAVMQVKDLQAQFGSLSAVVAKVGAFMAANPFLIGAAVIASVIALTAAWFG